MFRRVNHMVLIGKGVVVRYIRDGGVEIVEALRKGAAAASRATMLDLSTLQQQHVVIHTASSSAAHAQKRAKDGWRKISVLARRGQ